jgi:thiosulfate dehydrogenase [quinone] large subunit
MFRQQNNAVIGMVAGVITVIAGAWTIFHLIWNTTNNTADDYWGQALLVLFVVGVILAFAQYFAERPALKASISPNEQFPEPMIARFFFGSAGSAPMWFVLRMNVGAQWFLAGYAKLFGSESSSWATGTPLKGFVMGALAKSTGAYPSVQGWYANFLHDYVLPHVGLFAFLTSWGELAVGLGILLGALTGIAAGFGVLMNLNYLLSGTVSINPVLGMFGLFLVFSWRVCGWIGLDRFLLPALGLPWKAGALFQARQPSKPPIPVGTAS